MLGDKSFDELRSIKRELKAWESMFERKHSRKPNKDDVNGAPEEIRETYVRYRNLRKGVEKKEDPPNQDIKEDEVFGKSLNKSKDAVASGNRSIRVQMSPSDLKPIKLCHGQRLRKSLMKNFDKLSPEENSKTTETLSNAVSSHVNGSALSGDDFGMKEDDIGFSIVSKKQESLSRPGMMLGKSKVAERMKRRSAIASEWLEKHKPDVAETNMQSEDDVTSNPFSSPSKTQTIKPVSDACGSNLADPSAINSKDDEISYGSSNAYENFSPRKTKANNVKKSKTISRTQNKSTSLPLQNVNCNGKNSFEEVTVGEKILTTAKENRHSDVNNDQNQFSSVASAASSTPVSTFGGNEMAPEILNSDLDSVSVVKTTSSRAKSRTVSMTKRKRSTSVDDDKTADKAPEPFADVGENPSKIRRTNCSDDSDTETSQKEGTTKKRTQKRSSGLVSENFRALNMKVKRFTRHGHSTNYGAYKRKLWKQKQQQKEQGDKKPAPHWKKKKTMSTASRSRNPTGSTTTCFKCGEDGHWVKDCPRNKGGKPTAVTENWSEPVKLPPDLEIGEEAWKATESKLQLLMTERLPRPHSTLSNVPPAIEPLYQTENGKPIGAPEEVFDALNQLGFDSFRTGQEEAIMQILCGLSTLVVLSTGAGKSLCYQLPAYMYNKRSPCLTLVISPLVSLMEDQVVGLPFGLCGVSLNTNMTKPQRTKAVEQICSGKAAVVLVSPEALVGGGMGPGCLPHVSKLPPIAFACIDEAHCVSEWSHNFRPSYLRVCKVLRERFGVQCFLGLTATATRSTAISVAEHLGIDHRPDAIIRGAAIPPNLNLSVSCDLNRDRAILELLQGVRFCDCDSIIIYCTRRDQTDRLATFLRTCLQKNPLNTSSAITEQSEMEEAEEDGSNEKKRGRKRKSGAAKTSTKKAASKKSASWEAECYHAGMTAAQRRSVQKKFMSGELRIVVATVAFGMGLDKANVRAILHYNLPKSFESYVQEIGRAGRDGLPSHCHVFIDPEGKDVRELRRHAYASTIDRKLVKKLVAQIFPKCDCKTLEENMKARRDQALGRTSAGDADETLGTSGDVLKTEEPGGNTEPKAENFDWTDADDAQMLDDVMQFESSIQGHGGLGTDGSIQGEGDVDCEASRSQVIIECTAGKNGENNTSRDDLTSTEDVVATEEDVVATEEDVVATEEDVVATDGTMEEHSNAEPKHVRICGGHEVALPIEKAVQEMDMKEEGIATLLCYLELHENKWVQILQPVRATCTLKFYGGPAHLHLVAQKVPLVTAAVAYARERGELERNASALTFPIVEIVDKMGWDLDPARRELYALQWNDSLQLTSESGLSAGHSGILVEFKDLAFHLRAPGDLADDERDEICDFLEDRIFAQERSQVAQLHGVWSTFNEHAHANCWRSAEECDEKVDERLKSIVKAYFDSENDPTKVELETLAEARKNSTFVKSSLPASEEEVNWDSVSRDIRAFLNLHSDCELSGRAIARVFHGIDSPCFPAVVWGRDRRYWRRHLDVDFNQLRKFAIKELVRYR